MLRFYKIYVNDSLYQIIDSRGNFDQEKVIRAIIVVYQKNCRDTLFHNMTVYEFRKSHSGKHIWLKSILIHFIESSIIDDVRKATIVDTINIAFDKDINFIQKIPVHLTNGNMLEFMASQKWPTFKLKHLPS